MARRGFGTAGRYSVADHLKRVYVVEPEDEILAGHGKMADERVGAFLLYDPARDDDVLGAAARQRDAKPLPRRMLEPVHLSRGPANSCHGYSVVTGPMRTTSKSRPRICRSVRRSSSFQRASGAPEMNQFDPLSAKIIP